EHGLLLLELRAVARHRHEECAAELARCPLDEAEMAREPAELAVGAGYAALADEESGHPAGHVHAEPGQALELVAGGGLRVDHRAGALEMRVDGLACDEQPHDLARALEDQVDAQVAHQPLDRDRLLPTPLQ